MASAGSRWKIVLFLFIISAFFATVLSFVPMTHTSPVSLGNLPLRIGSFTGRELPVEQSVKDILETPNVMVRDYLSPNGLHVTLAIVYYDRYRVHFHMPDGCMVGKGTIVVATERESLNVPEEKREPLIVNKLVLKHSEVKEHVFYFFMTGDLITPSYSKMRLRLMTDYLRRKDAGAALIRFSIRTDESSEELALKTIKDFIGHTAAILPAYVS